MNRTTQRLDSCLVWFGGVFGSLLLIFVISYIVDTIRLANAWNEAYALAAQLGYTPERHLADKVRIQPPHLLLGTAGCEVQVFFTTPLNRSDFAAHLEQAVAPLRDGSPTDGRNMYLQLPFVVDGNNALRLYRGQIDRLPPVYEHYWLVTEGDSPIKMTIFYAELSQANAKIEYDFRPITENVAYVGVDAGEFPFWIWASRCIGLQR
jgi:hypothetical protein